MQYFDEMCTQKSKILQKIQTASLALDAPLQFTIIVANCLREEEGMSCSSHEHAGADHQSDTTGSSDDWLNKRVKTTKNQRQIINTLFTYILLL